MTVEYEFCGKCGAKIEDADQMFCKQCGNALASENNVIESEKIEILEVKDSEPIVHKINDGSIDKDQVKKQKVQKSLQSPKKEKKKRSHEDLEIYSKNLTGLAVI